MEKLLKLSYDNGLEEILADDIDMEFLNKELGGPVGVDNMLPAKLKNVCMLINKDSKDVKNNYPVSLISTKDEFPADVQCGNILFVGLKGKDQRLVGLSAEQIATIKKDLHKVKIRRTVGLDSVNDYVMGFTL